MSAAVQLVRAILGAHCTSDMAAHDVLEQALEREVDPMLYCAATLGIGETLAMERAAAWLNLAFAPLVPGSERTLAPAQLETLFDVRMFRLREADGDVAFCAPDFFGLLRLRTRRHDIPGLQQRLCLVPRAALQRYLVACAGEALTDGARQNLARQWPHAAAQLELTVLARYGFVGIVALLVAVVLLAPYLGQPWLLTIWAILLVGPAAIRVAAIFVAHPAPAPQEPLDDAELPHYSVLVPLRDEAHMVPQLFRSLGALNYPPERLDIKFVVEQRSLATVDAVESLLGDSRFSLVIVPDAAPRTKPKALDFALPLCQGEHVVVFDAEDRPHPDQLRQVAQRFRAAPDVHCIQAELVIDNASENWLAGMFAAEYAGLFSVLLPALARWGLVVPLGGTSNHFRIATLRALGGWDAYNVTEDADLGVRLARRGYRVETIASPTFEEAPTQLRVWLNQRTRWMKGWMQTMIVHNRRPGQLLADVGPFGMAIVNLLVMGMIMAPLLHSSFVMISLARALAGVPILTFDRLWAVIFCAVLLLGYGSIVALNLVGLRRLDRPRPDWAQLTLPIYWLLSAWATLRALRELVKRPFDWSKTPHRTSRRGPVFGMEFQQTPAAAPAIVLVAQDGASKR